MSLLNRIKPKPAQPKPPRLHQLLGTKDERAQVQQVVNLAGAPMIVVTIMCDLRDGHVDVALLGDRGHGLPTNVVYNMLDQARRLLQSRERGQLPAASQSPQEGQGASPAAAPVQNDPAPGVSLADGPDDTDEDY